MVVAAAAACLPAAAIAATVIANHAAMACPSQSTASFRRVVYADRLIVTIPLPHRHQTVTMSLPCRHGRVYVDRLIVGPSYEKRIEKRTTGSGGADLAGAASKLSESRLRIVKRAAKEFRDGMYVNLGIGCALALEVVAMVVAAAAAVAGDTGNDGSHRRQREPPPSGCVRQPCVGGALQVTQASVRPNTTPRLHRALVCPFSRQDPHPREQLPAGRRQHRAAERERPPWHRPLPDRRQGAGRYYA